MHTRPLFRVPHPLNPSSSRTAKRQRAEYSKDLGKGMEDRTFPSPIFWLIWRHYVSSTLMGSPNTESDASLLQKAPFGEGRVETCDSLRGKPPFPCIRNTFGDGFKPNPSQSRSVTLFPALPGLRRSRSQEQTQSIFCSALGSELQRGTGPGFPDSGDMLSHGCTQHLPFEGFRV